VTNASPPGYDRGMPTRSILPLLALFTLASCTHSGAPTHHAAKQATQETANQQLVTDFYAEVFNRHNVAAAPNYLAEDYRQHNPLAATGRQAFMDFFSKFFQQNPDWHVTIKHIAADGDLVWVHYHAQRNAEDRGMAVVDIFRVTGGKMVEHWDVVQPVPEKSANANTMF
jgi:predicted SnoaL-like aldol condensation-catalyzing enzyme